MLEELAIGIFSANLTILVIHTLPAKIHDKFYAIALIFAALIYLGFSFVSQNTSWILTESLGLIIFSIIAFTGIKFSSWLLAIGWLIHPAWDLLIDNHNLTSFVPQWYPIFCIGYDILMSLYIAWKCIKTEENNPFIN